MSSVRTIMPLSRVVLCTLTRTPPRAGAGPDVGLDRGLIVGEHVEALLRSLRSANHSGQGRFNARRGLDRGGEFGGVGGGERHHRRRRSRRAGGGRRRRRRRCADRADSRSRCSVAAMVAATSRPRRRWPAAKTARMAASALVGNGEGAGLREALHQAVDGRRRRGRSPRTAGARSWTRPGCPSRGWWSATTSRTS